MKKMNLFRKNNKIKNQLIPEEELKNVERIKTNILDETFLIDSDLSIIRNFKDDDIKVIDFSKDNNFYNENVIDLEKELLEEITPKKKPRLWRYLMFGILAILVVVIIIIIALQVEW